MKKKKSLIETNKYLKDSTKRDKLVRKSVLTSSGVEGIFVKLAPLKKKTTRKASATSRPAKSVRLSKAGTGTKVTKIIDTTKPKRIAKKVSVKKPTKKTKSAQK